MARYVNHLHDDLSTGEAAYYFGVHSQTVINWCEMGRLKWRRIDGGPRRIPRREVAEVLRRNNLPVPPELEENRLEAVAA